MATSAKELEKLAIRLVGDGAHYERVLDKAVKDTTVAAQKITATNKAQAAATKQATKAVSAANKKQAAIAKVAAQKAAKAQKIYNDQLRRAKTVIEAVRTPVMKYKRELADLRRLQKKGAIGARTHQLAIARLNREFAIGRFAVAKYAASVQSVGKRMAMVGGMMTLGVTLPIVGVGIAMLRSAAEVETFETQFQSMLRSIPAGTKMIADLRKMASVTPFRFPGLAGATRTLLAFGVAQEDVLPRLSMLGDISAGTGKDIKELGVIFGQVKGLTRLMGQDFNQLANAGFPVKEIAKVMGTDMKTLRQEMEKGNVPFEAVLQAMKNVTAEGGIFHNMMDTLSKTAAGRWSTALDNIGIMFADFGAVMMPVASAVLEWVISVSKWFGKLDVFWKRIILGIGALVAAAGPLLLIFGTLAAAVSGIIGLFAGLSIVAIKIIAIVAAVAAVIALVVAQFAALIYALKVVIDYIWGPGSFSAALWGAVAVAKDWAMAVIGFVWNIGKNFNMLMMWLPLNWGNIMSDMLQAALLFIVNTGHNIKILIFTMVRLFTLFQGFAIGMFKNVFDVNFSHWMEVGVGKAAKILFDFVDSSWEALKSIFTGGGLKKQGLADLAGALMGDLEKGINSKDIMADAGRIVKDQARLLKTPLEGFKSSLTTLPKFALDIGEKTAKAIGDPIKDEQTDLEKWDPSKGTADGVGGKGKGNKDQQFKVMSLQRFALDSVGNSAKKKTQSEDKVVASKLDTLIDITRRSVGGGGVATFGK